MEEKARRNLGAHYTSEENIQKLIKPLFLDELWEEFGKVKGNRNKLFEEMLPLASFDATMRETLLDCCALDWSAISPAIFGALFQSIMDE